MTIDFIVGRQRRATKSESCFGVARLAGRTPKRSATRLWTPSTITPRPTLWNTSSHTVMIAGSTTPVTVTTTMTAERMGCGTSGCVWAASVLSTTVKRNIADVSHDGGTGSGWDAILDSCDLHRLRLLRRSKAAKSAVKMTTPIHAVSTQANRHRHVGHHHIE